MERKAFYTKEQALEYAEKLAKECNGYVASKVIAMDCNYFDIPEELSNWSGEIAALQVINENYDAVATIGYWE